MDTERFDRFARAVGAGADRRRRLAGLLGTASAASARSLPRRDDGERGRVGRVPWRGPEPAAG